MERMDHFQLRQDQQTLILREIQQHLGLCHRPPVAPVPSSLRSGAYYLIIRSLLSLFISFWIIKTSQVKERSKEENRVKRTEDSSCSLPSHFWSTFRSSFSTCYIPFQSSGSQESNASNRVRFGAEMRKIWPLEDNCSKHYFLSCAFHSLETSHVISDSCPIGVSLIRVQLVLLD
ncbi:hypothetical protein AAG906_008138 [Vitis piasezkii]